jgi:diaminopimelate decarboxylase
MSEWDETGVFARRGGTLHAEDCPIPELAARYGTPLYVVSERALRSRAREMHRAFAAEWHHGEVTVLPAIKANYAVAVQRILAQEGCGADLFGAGELEVAVRAGLDPARLSLNGTAKDATTIQRAVELGARITVDSVREIELAREAAARVGRRAEVRVRVRPVVDLELGSDAYDGVPIRDAYGRYKPGIPADDLRAAGEALRAPELELAGAMMHFGRHTTDLDAFGAVIDRFAAIIGDLARLWDGWTPRTIDVGGGIAHHGDPHGQADADAASHPRVPSLDAYARTICGRLSAGLIEAGIDPAGRDLEIEPGRALFGPCGIHVARVLHAKRQSAPFPHAWLEVDSSQAFLPDVVLERCRYPIAVVDGPDASAPRHEVDVVGISCTADVLAEGERLPALAPGALLCFGLTGAYQDAGATNFNVLPRPATVLVRDAESHVIRARETVADVLARDIVPAHLAGEAGPPPPAPTSVSA